MWTLLSFFLSFFISFGYSTEKSKTSFSKLESPSRFCILILNGAQNLTLPVAEFKEFERRFKFKPRLKYGWIHLKLYKMFQDLIRRLI